VRILVTVYIGSRVHDVIVHIVLFTDGGVASKVPLCCRCKSFFPGEQTVS
jgi:hypothetical protein